MKLPPNLPPHTRAAVPATPQDKAMHKAADGLEATFIGEMLKPMGADTARESFGGGIGEEQFSSFMREEEAKAMVKAGGVGLSESIFRSMKNAAGAGNGTK